MLTQRQLMEEATAQAKKERAKKKKEEGGDEEEVRAVFGRVHRELQGPGSLVLLLGERRGGCAEG